MSANVALPTYSRYLLAAALSKGPHTLASLMAAVEDAPWAAGRTEAEFREFLDQMAGVSLVDGLYVSDVATSRGRVAPVVAHGKVRNAAAASTSHGEGELPVPLATVVAAAGLDLVDGPTTASMVSGSPARIEFWIFLDPRPFVGGRYLATVVGEGASITPDLVAQVIRLTEDHHADRALIVGLRPISAAAQAYAQGKPVTLLSAAEVARLGRAARGE